MSHHDQEWYAAAQAELTQALAERHTELARAIASQEFELASALCESLQATLRKLSECEKRLHAHRYTQSRQGSLLLDPPELRGR